MNKIISFENPLVSVCIPTYNRADRLKRAVEKILDCTYKNVEIIISDNASTDHTQEVCAQLCTSSPMIHYFRHNLNQGPTKNFEFARSKVSGKYFVWLGDDDYFSSNYISLCVRELEADPLLVLVSGLAAYHKGDDVLTQYGNIVQPVSNLGIIRVLEYIFKVWDNSIFCGVYRTESVASCAAPNCLAGDWVWVAEVLLEGRVKILPNVYIYRQQGDSTSSTVDRIVEVLGLPPWHATYPWLVIPNNIAYQIAFRSSFYGKSMVLKKYFIYFLIFFSSLAKQFSIFISSKIEMLKLKLKF